MSAGLSSYVETIYRLVCNGCGVGRTSLRKATLVSSAERDGWMTTIDDEAHCPRCVQKVRTPINREASDG